jgi:hypothetical protein
MIYCSKIISYSFYPHYLHDCRLQNRYQLSSLTLTWMALLFACGRLISAFCCIDIRTRTYWLKVFQPCPPLASVLLLTWTYVFKKKSNTGRENWYDRGNMFIFLCLRNITVSASRACRREAIWFVEVKDLEVWTIYGEQLTLGSTRSSRREVIVNLY